MTDPPIHSRARRYVVHVSVEAQVDWLARIATIVPCQFRFAEDLHLLIVTGTCSVAAGTRGRKGVGGESRVKL